MKSRPRHQRQPSQVVTFDLAKINAPIQPQMMARKKVSFHPQSSSNNTNSPSESTSEEQPRMPSNQQDPSRNFVELDD